MSAPLPPRRHMLDLIRDVFYPRFVGAGKIVRLSKTGYAARASKRCKNVNLGFACRKCKRLPNVIIDHASCGWLILVDIEDCNGLIDTNRRNELLALFTSVEKDIVFVTAFSDMETFGKKQRFLAWGTSAWIADAPDHMVVFNGRRLIGPQ